MTKEQQGSSHQKTGRRPLYILGAATTILGATCIGLCSHLIYEKVKSDSENMGNGDRIFKCPQNTPEIKEKFPGIFSSDEDIQKMRKAGIYSYRPVINGSNGMTNVTSPFNGSTTTTALYRNQRLIDSLGFCSEIPPNSLSHCCCNSWFYIEAPTTLPSGESGRNGNVTIYQTPDYKQYFIFVNCCQQRNCQENCQCHLLYILTSAVVVVPDSGGTLCQFQIVRVLSCCMCLNN